MKLNVTDLIAIFLSGTDFDPDIPYAYLGPVCSVSTTLTATIASQYINTVQVSYGVLSPLFSDVTTYSYFYRTVPDFITYVEPIAAILEHFDWQVIGIVLSDSVRHGLLNEALVNFLRVRNSNFKIATTVSYFDLEGENLQNSVRIFIGMVGESMTADTLCAAYGAGLTGRNFVWIILGDFFDGWWRNFQNMECTEEQMLEAIESTLILSNIRRISYETFTTIKSQNISAFWEDFSGHLKHSTGLDFVETRAIRVLQSYDAVWTIIKALDITLNEGNFTETIEDESNNSLITSGRVKRLHRELNRNMKRLSFEGTSGRIEFTDEFNGPQLPTTTIFQMQNSSIVPVGIHQGSAAVDFSFFRSNLTWQSEEPPRDRPVVRFKVVEIWIIVVMLIFTGIGFVYAIGILVLNIVYRKHKVIKASSPYINILIIAGLFCGLLLIPIMSIQHLDEDRIIPDAAYLFICNSEVWLAFIALTLAFGSLLAKTWRVYVIFRNPWVKARPYKDHVLLCMVGVLLILDVFLLSLTTGRVQLTLNIYTSPLPAEQFAINAHRLCLTGASLYDPSVEFLVWIGILSLIKLLLFLFGVFLVFQTSKIKAKFFQDSKFVGLSIYVTFFTCGVGIPASFGLLLALEEDISFVCSSLTILLCVFFILSAVFIPRFSLLVKYKQKVPTAVLIGLNPSFRIRRPTGFGLGGKKKGLRDSQSTEGSVEATSTVALVSPYSARSLPALTSTRCDNDLIPDTVWEPAYDEEPTSPARVISGEDNYAVKVCTFKFCIVHVTYTTDDIALLCYLIRFSARVMFLLAYICSFACTTLTRSTNTPLQNPYTQFNSPINNRTHCHHDGDTVVSTVSISVQVHN